MAWLVSAPIAGLAATPATPTITLNVQTGPPGTTVTITGKGFPPQEIVALYIDQAGPFLDVPGPRADDQGAIGFGTGPEFILGAGRSAAVVAECADHIAAAAVFFRRIAADAVLWRIAPSRAIVSTTGKKIGKNLFFGAGSRILATKSRVAASHGSLG